MRPEQANNLLSLEERMDRLRTRISLEKISGIALNDKDAFLAFCREREGAGYHAEWESLKAFSAGGGDWGEINPLF